MIVESHPDANKTLSIATRRLSPGDLTYYLVISFCLEERN